jgi:RND family efflux transporter MFP subunit
MPWSDALLPAAARVSKRLLFAAIVQAALWTAAHAASKAPASVVVRAEESATAAPFDGIVEAVQQTVIASQVSGTVVELAVKAGDPVKKGQVLARIDARAALQGNAASAAQVLSARAALDMAARDYERQQQLARQHYISQAAMERAETQFKATSAQLNAQIAQAGASQVQADYFIVRAPYAGVVADVPVSLGDMAMPGRPLLTLYNPASLRVTAAVPQTVAAQLKPDQPVKVELPSLPAGQQWLTRPRVQVLPTADAGTHSIPVRVDLPNDMANMAPGMFARLWLPARPHGGSRLYVPAAAVVRRAEMSGVYVIDGRGRALLRQVRLGPAQGDMIEVLAGVSAGERIALDPHAAAKQPQ